MRLLNAHDVTYVIIGAMAFPHHGYARATLDIDLFIEPSLDNARSCRRALQKFGYDMTDCTPEELIAKKVLIRQYAVACDIHPYVAGATWDQVWSHRVQGEMGSTPVFFAALDDLIRMKEAAGRPKDLEDLKFLRALRKG